MTHAWLLPEAIFTAALAAFAFAEWIHRRRKRKALPTRITRPIGHTRRASPHRRLVERRADLIRQSEAVHARAAKRGRVLRWRKGRMTSSELDLFDAVIAQVQAIDREIDIERAQREHPANPTRREP